MEYDSPTSLYHTYARYYSPGLQRFLSEDPLQFGGGDVNLFGYAGNDPVGHKDPLGLYLGPVGVVPPGSSITSPMDNGIGGYIATGSPAGGYENVDPESGLPVDPAITPGPEGAGTISIGGSALNPAGVISIGGGSTGTIGPISGAPAELQLAQAAAPVPPGYRHRRFPTPRHRRRHQACRCLRQRRQRSRCLAGSNVGTRTKNTWAGGAVLPAGRVRQEAVPWHVRHYFSADRRHTALALRGAASWAGEQSRHALRRPPFGTGSAKALVTANESFNFSAGLTDTASGVKKERWMQERRVYDIGSYAVSSWGLSRLRSVSGRQSAY